jgi:hypothetical protein
MHRKGIGVDRCLIAMYILSNSECVISSSNNHCDAERSDRSILNKLSRKIK